MVCLSPKNSLDKYTDFATKLIQSTCRRCWGIRTVHSTNNAQNISLRENNES